MLSQAAKEMVGYKVLQDLWKELTPARHKTKYININLKISHIVFHVILLLIRSNWPMHVLPINLNFGGDLTSNTRMK